MGDRCNFVFSTKKVSDKATFKQAVEGQVVLYSHSGGHERMKDLANAIRDAKGSWGDEGYFTRIVISQLVGEDWRGEYGYGIYVGEICDNEHPVLVIDIPSQHVAEFDDTGEQRRITNWMSFTDFINGKEMVKAVQP